MLDTGDRRRGLPAGSVDHGDDARPLDTGWTLLWGRRRLGEQPPGPLSSKDAEGIHAAADGPGHRRDRQLQVVRRRPAGALAHCCRVLDWDGTRGGQWDYGKVRCAGRAGEGVLMGS